MNDVIHIENLQYNFFVNHSIRIFLKKKKKKRYSIE